MKLLLRFRLENLLYFTPFRLDFLLLVEFFFFFFCRNLFAIGLSLFFLNSSLRHFINSELNCGETIIVFIYFLSFFPGIQKSKLVASRLAMLFVKRSTYYKVEKIWQNLLTERLNINFQNVFSVSKCNY